MVDYKIKHLSTIHLMISLYDIPEDMNHVVFDLSWTYPNHGRDFLDASCLMFTGDVWYMFIDWRQPEVYGSNNQKAVWHSGDLIDDKNRQGHHIIEAKLKNIPRCVSHMVFTLSSFKSPTIGCFPKLGLRFYEAQKKERDLCQTTFTNALNAQGLIVCSVSRRQDGGWKIEKGGMPTAGNVKTYYPIRDSILGMRRSNLITGFLLEQGQTLLRTMNAVEELQYERKCERRMK